MANIVKAMIGVLGLAVLSQGAPLFSNVNDISQVYQGNMNTDVAALGPISVINKENFINDESKQH